MWYNGEKQYVLNRNRAVPEAIRSIIIEASDYRLGNDTFLFGISIM